jgi:hypothetical protein
MRNKLRQVIEELDRRTKEAESSASGMPIRDLALSHVRGEKHYCTYHGIKFGCNRPAFEGGHGDFGLFCVERRQTPCDIR